MTASTTLVYNVQGIGTSEGPDVTESRAQRYSLSIHAGLTLLMRIHRDALLCMSVILLSAIGAFLTSTSPKSIFLGIGSVGDRLLLQRTTGTGGMTDGSWFADELSPGASTGRSRWTQQDSEVVLPVGGIGSISVEVAGWPTHSQPQVTLSIDDVMIGSITPTNRFRTYELPVISLAATDTHTLRLTTSVVLTNTVGFIDPRQKGVRVAAVTLNPAHNGFVVFPFWRVFAFYMCVLGVCCAFLVRSVRTNWVRFGTVTLAATLCGFVMSSLGVWVVSVTQGMLMFALIISSCFFFPRIIPTLGGIWRRMRRQKLPIFAGALVLFGCIATAAVGTGTRAGQLWLICLAVAWLIERAVSGTFLRNIDRYRDRFALYLRIGVYAFLAGWILWWIQQASFIGHADYADNVVVARNVVRGRGFVVDYVTQFYRIYASVTHPQETWPILQPVWIAISFILFGVTDTAARIPNIVFWGMLVWLVDRFARRLWGSHVALMSVALLTLNVFMYRQMNFATTDIAFVVFATAAFQGVWMLPQDGQSYWANGWLRSTPVKAMTTGGWTGLMLLQKPGSAAMIALGMGIWLLITWIWPMLRPRVQWSIFWSRIRSMSIWAAIALLILAPYLIRNLVLYGKAIQTTESFDAWILEYTHWDAIYRVYAADGGIGSGDLPERSWILRWGFDAILQKIWIQWNVIQDYLLPSFTAFPSPINEFGAASGATGLLGGFALWCALIGVLISAGRHHAPLWRMIGFCMIPYTVFLMTYWHANEPRYWVLLLPWLAMAAAHGIQSAADGIGHYSPRGLVHAVLLCGLVVYAVTPPLNSIRKASVRDEALVQADRNLYAFLRAETAPDAVMMTRVPWQLQWYSDRPALMIPADADATTILRLAKHYQVRYLVLDSLQRPNAATRAVLATMIAAPQSGFALRYRTKAYPVNDHGRQFTMVSEVYEFPPDYQGVTPIW